MKNYQLFINGEWVASSTGQTDDIINPADESLVGQVEMASEADADKALQAAEAAQVAWRRLPARQRADLLRAFTKEIQANRELLAELITKEQGKLFKVAQFEVDVTCSFIEYACEWARRIEGDILLFISSETSNSNAR